MEAFLRIIFFIVIFIFVKLWLVVFVAVFALLICICLSFEIWGRFVELLVLTLLIWWWRVASFDRLFIAGSRSRTITRGRCLSDGFFFWFRKFTFFLFRIVRCMHTITRNWFNTFLPYDLVIQFLLSQLSLGWCFCRFCFLLRCIWFLSRFIQCPEIVILCAIDMLKLLLLWRSRGVNRTCDLLLVRYWWIGEQSSTCVGVSAIVDNWIVCLCLARRQLELHTKLLEVFYLIVELLNLLVLCLYLSLERALTGHHVSVLLHNLVNSQCLWLVLLELVL